MINTKIEIDQKKLRKDLELLYGYKRRTMVSHHLSKALLTIACPLIEEKLTNVQNLPRFRGKRGFYDVESDAELSKTRHLKLKHEKVGHLKDNWHVDFEAGLGGHGRVLISNSKKVEGKGGSMLELHVLLWWGTSTYEIPWVRTRKEENELGLPRGSLLHKPMNFYNRYTEHMNWKRYKRRGIEWEVVSTFQKYVLDIVNDSIEEAAMILNKEEREHDDIKKAFE